LRGGVVVVVLCALVGALTGHSKGRPGGAALFSVPEELVPKVAEEQAKRR
jgi:hypothetical protein